MAHLSGKTSTQDIVRFFYSLLLSVILFFPALIGAGKCIVLPAQRKRWLNRCGFGLQGTPVGATLVHCVSVGEVVTATPLIRQLMVTEPDTPIVITTTTETGRDQVKRNFGNTVHHHFLPWDLPRFTSRFLAILQPKRILITEVELWPNFIAIASAALIPVILVNARMTARSASRYKKFSALAEPMLSGLTHICAQGQRDLESYRQLGIDSDRLSLTNNLKFDLPVPDPVAAGELRTAMQLTHRKVILGGSTHDGEEQALLDAMQSLLALDPTLLLILVPRHPERFEDVFKLASSTPLTVQRLSASAQCAESSQVLIVDKMGQLRDLYGIADIAFVGGSLTPRGGHNALEAAVHGCPVVMGPSQYNNPQIGQVLKDAGGLVIVETELALQEQLRDWLSHPAHAAHAGKQASAAVTSHRGAIQRTLDVILSA